MPEVARCHVSTTISTGAPSRHWSIAVANFFRSATAITFNGTSTAIKWPGAGRVSRSCIHPRVAMRTPSASSSARKTTFHPFRVGRSHQSRSHATERPRSTATEVLPVPRFALNQLRPKAGKVFQTRYSRNTGSKAHSRTSFRSGVSDGSTARSTRNSSPASSTWGMSSSSAVLSTTSFSLSEGWKTSAICSGVSRCAHIPSPWPTRTRCALYDGDFEPGRFWPKR